LNSRPSRVPKDRRLRTSKKSSPPTYLQPGSWPNFVAGENGWHHQPFTFREARSLSCSSPHDSVFRGVENLIENSIPDLVLRSFCSGQVAWIHNLTLVELKRTSSTTAPCSGAVSGSRSLTKQPRQTTRTVVPPQLDRSPPSGCHSLAHRVSGAYARAGPRILAGRHSTATR
jgi:hypothetical protein